MSIKRPFTPASAVRALAAVGVAFFSCDAVRANDDPWPGLRKEMFAERNIATESGAVRLEAPYRADDAAVVPITVRIPAEYASSARTLTLIVDKNPAPVVATFTFGPAAGDGERIVSTRIRIDMYSNVRAVLETADGGLHMTAAFVKAAGGCSAPALKDADEALASLGEMRVKQLPGEGGGPPEAQVMIRHPNYSGMQMNQLTGLYIPAKFVEEIEAKRGGETIFRMTGGISLSENPNIRFTYGGSGPIEVTARDTDGRTFAARSEATGS